MSDIGVTVGADYPLNGVITNFEAYMFITVQKFIINHHKIEGEITTVMHDGFVHIESMSNLNDRKAALTAFNETASVHIPSLPKSTGLSCCMIEFDIDGVIDDDDVNELYMEIRQTFIDWLVENNRVGVMVQHFYQKNRPPHLHILYERRNRKHDEFQTYLLDTYNS